MIVAKNIVASGPAFDCIIVDCIAPFGVLCKGLKEVRVEKIHPVDRNLELIIQISNAM